MHLVARAEVTPDGSAEEHSFDGATAGRMDVAQNAKKEILVITFAMTTPPQRIISWSPKPELC